MSRTSKSLLLISVVILLLACQVPGFATSTTPAPTEAVPTNAPVIEPTPTEVIVFHSEKFTSYSPNGKHTTKLVTDDGGQTWNLVLDGKVRDEDVEEIGPTVWSPESDAFVLPSSDGICYYVGKNIGNVPLFCYYDFTDATAISYVGGYQGEKIWFVSGGSIYSVTPDLKSNPKLFDVQKILDDDKTEILDVAVSKNGYYLAATSQTGELLVFETSGKFIRAYDCTNATWALDGKVACVTLDNTDASILLVDITKPGQEVAVNVKGLRPQQLLFSPNSNKLAFYDAGGVFWLRLSDNEIFYASDPNGLGFNHSWRPNTAYLVYDQCVDLVCKSVEVVPATKNVWKHK